MTGISTSAFLAGYIFVTMKATFSLSSKSEKRLWNRGFVALMVTQVLGATNDNLLKAVLLTAVATGGVWGETLGKGGTGWVSFMLTAPFVVWLGYAGQLADRLPKNRLVVGTRIAEVPIALLALLGFVIDSPWIVMAAFLLLCSESAFFSPAKYGVIREYVGRPQLSRANGTINGSTNVAIILGTAVGGYLLQIGMGWAGGVLVAMAVIGLAASLFMPYAPAVNPTLPWSWNPFRSYWVSISDMRHAARHEKNPSPLWIAVLAWAWFYMIAIIILSVVPEYKEPLQLSEPETSGLLAAVGIGVGLGCIAAAASSGRQIRPWFVPWGGFGMASVTLALGVMDPRFMPLWGLWVAIIAAGVAGGFYIVPLQAMQQALSAPEMRARVLATANALSFLLMAFGSLLYILAVGKMGIQPTRMFLFCGIGMACLTTWIVTGGRILLGRRATFS